MFCNKCGNEVFPNQKYCNKCGNLLTYNIQKQQTNEYQNEKNNYNINNHYNTKSNLILIKTVIILILLMIIITIVLILNNSKNNFTFDDGEVIGETEQTSIAQTSTNNTANTATKSKYKTAIITDNVYSGLSLNSIDDAYELIREDSVNQKQSDYSKEIIQIENDIINKYSITAVNLKEMDVDFAKELENVIDNIYTNYPEARGYLTNLTLTNLDISDSKVIALFMPVYVFGTSNTKTTRPWVIKTQVQLNAKYFLNQEKMKIAVETSSKAGHFPANATKYSPVAHELGHYLSFIALMNYYSTNNITFINDNKVQSYLDITKDFSSGDFSKKMLDEAYQNYIKDNGNIDFDEWRGQISKYALAKNNSGNYIYDETVAEAFHDVYLNNENAKAPSKYIVEVLKKYIKG